MSGDAGGWDAFIASELDRRARDDALRILRPLAREGARVTVADGRTLLDFSSNDYLGLAAHPVVREAAARASRAGAGATASRLVVGTDPRTALLEEKLAGFQQTEAAVVFGSGYLANVGVLSALAGDGDAIFSDSLNHASIIDGCRLSRATVHRYGHLDLDELDAKLALASRQGARRKLIVTESVFSMDGDAAPLDEIVQLKERHGAALVVDEAHADGVFGRHGEGRAHALGVAERVDLHVGTFGKAFGVYGAYVAGRAPWIRFVVNAARSFVFTTGLPPAVIGAVGAALELVREAHEERRHLLEQAARFRAGLTALGHDTSGSTTQIVPLVAGANDAALRLSAALEEAGVLAVAIRPPTVPPGAARLRFSLSALHTADDVDLALAAIERSA